MCGVCVCVYMCVCACVCVCVCPCECKLLLVHTELIFGRPCNVYEAITFIYTVDIDIMSVASVIPIQVHVEYMQIR